ncbi:sigma-70 family RNA polymerase sigma factor [Solirubrobacter ginsenosidimutans]|uniref:Sigma-70 family RNA polymerase sigma factor n=1 Tax=Solirubrobacter ginsenosidimutans TaxID=490573 RepID=A0A9X3S5Q8_9ACTN|nr:sigma-70 family RNA polymerase sigma factor [Solirubrobacter ginsenosidimutans]MDA0164386.1 sigma-70 family RNA polymerase sigma factor [Solirubrobacter ginsenosidimutans]
MSTALSGSGHLASVVRRSVTRSPAARGDAAAFAELYERHHQALYRYCGSILHHEQDAQDALQSTMTRAFAALRDEPRDFELRPWLFRIAHNEAISLLRRRRPTDEIDELRTTEASVEDQVCLRADLEVLRLDLQALTERQRAALVLRELNGLSHREIAEALECTPNAVKQSIFEARTRLLYAREGREMECETVRRALSDGDGRVLRSGRMRAHLRSCSSCRAFQQALVDRPRELALLAPPMPVAASAALLASLLPLSAAATTGVVSATTAAAFAPKVAATVAVLVAAAGGTAAVHDSRTPSPPRPPVERPAPAKVVVASPKAVVVARTGERDIAPPSPRAATVTRSSPASTHTRHAKSNRRAKAPRTHAAAAKSRGRGRERASVAHAHTPNGVARGQQRPKTSNRSATAGHSVAKKKAPSTRPGAATKRAANTPRGRSRKP